MKKKILLCYLGVICIVYLSFMNIFVLTPRLMAYRRVIDLFCLR